MAASRVHLSGYQARDFEVVDYQMTELDDTGLWFRGPIPALDADYFACVGAAQTLGCFCPDPYPSLVADAIGLPAVNLGYGGAGPEFFVRHADALAPVLNGARFVVLQVMSGRSQSNSLYECGGLEYATRRSDGVQLGAQRILQEHMLAPPATVFGRRVPTRIRRRLPNPRVEARMAPLVDEMRSRWLESTRSLLDLIDVPVVLLWFSKRSPDYEVRYDDIASVFGAFPQLVNGELLAHVRTLCARYVEVVSDRGSPQALVSRFTGRPALADPGKDRADLGGRLWTHNNYYPSPEMHEDAAAALEPVCRQLVAEGPDQGVPG